MSNSVNVIGAGGHARPIVQLLSHLGFSIGGIYDRSFNPEVEEKILQIEVKGVFPSVSDQRKLVLAVGSNDLRKELFEHHGNLVLEDSLVHPAAFIEPSVHLGSSNIIFAKSYLSSMSQVGDNTIVNAGAIIEHESFVGSHCHISVGVLVCGRVSIGDNCFIGAGAVIRDKVSICDNVLLGAGTVVVKDITEPGVYVGNPAKRIK
jgi:UDP-N-acetylbacillosamine N-acetyltransferase